MQLTCNNLMRLRLNNKSGRRKTAKNALKTVMTDCHPLHCHPLPLGGNLPLAGGNLAGKVAICQIFYQFFTIAQHRRRRPFDTPSRISAKIASQSLKLPLKNGGGKFQAAICQSLMAIRRAGRKILVRNQKLPLIKTRWQSSLLYIYQWNTRSLLLIININIKNPQWGKRKKGNSKLIQIRGKRVKVGGNINNNCTCQKRYSFDSVRFLLEG